MGQTLSHGVYLPNEGERNCYAGLASNWQILNTAVGAIAEKAPLVHTHTVSQITDFPAYGTTAGTICEGNDSRLSDARTPVAHTHGKADITDLFNSANMWSNKNTFSDLNPIILKNSNIEKGVQPTDFQVQSVLFKDKNDSNVAYIRHLVNKSGTTNFNIDGLEFSIANKFANSTLDPTGTNTTGTFRIGFWSDGQKYIYNEFRWRSSLIPFNNQTQDIGTSTNQWNNLYAKKVNTQSVNGVNPGALSLPSASYIDISSSITDRNYGANYYTAPSNGYVCIGSMASSLQISNDTLGFGISAGTAQDGYSSVYIPVRTGDTVKILLNQTSTDYQTFRFYSCQGNV